MALLQDDFWPAIFRDDVDGGPTVEAHSIVPFRSDHITSCFLELERLNQELKSKLRDDFLDILNGMGSISLSTPQPPSPSPTPPSRSLSLIHGTSFIAEAYSWLLENIANPYPSPTVKASLVQRYNSPLSAINSWFINARRRIGWTTLCRNHFNNCRADALDAAYRALVKEDPNRQLPAHITHAFISVKAAAEELYSSTLTKSALSIDLDNVVVKDMSVQRGVPVNEQRCSEPKGTMELSKASNVDLQNEMLVARNYYPSPDQSPSSSSVPALDEYLTNESEDDDDIVPPTLAGRKRRFSPSEGTHATKLAKRPRLSPGVPSSANSCLPSPATSAEESLEKNDQMPRSVPITQTPPNPRPHKRRLSNVDTTRLPTRSRDSMAGPCPHAVSDLLPLSTLESEHSIDEWFQSNFDALFTLPPPVDVSEPDHSTQWEVELFNNYSMPEDPQETFALPIQDNQISSTDLIAFEDILQSLDSGGFYAPPDIACPPTMALVPDPVPQGLLFPDLSQTIDWTALLNEDPSEEPTCGPVFPRSYVDSSLPEIDSILQLPQVWTTVAS
ncbi:C-terminal domain of homeodomain 1-domain-containing protein [Boletus edulis]|nr:C-terminal domain of homeodomain 1-domain-containing protein [Boletus edulis]